MIWSLFLFHDSIKLLNLFLSNKLFKQNLIQKGMPIQNCHISNKILSVSCINHSESTDSSCGCDSTVLLIVYKLVNFPGT